MDLLELWPDSWFFLSSFGDGSEALMVSQGCQDSFLIARDTLGFFLSHGRGNRTHLELRRKFQHPFPVATGILWLVFSRGVRHHLVLRHGSPLWSQD